MSRLFDALQKIDAKEPGGREGDAPAFSGLEPNEPSQGPALKSKRIIIYASVFALFIFSGIGLLYYVSSIEESFKSSPRLSSRGGFHQNVSPQLPSGSLMTSASGAADIQKRLQPADSLPMPQKAQEPSTLLRKLDVEEAVLSSRKRGVELENSERPMERQRQGSEEPREEVNLASPGYRHPVTEKDGSMFSSSEKRLLQQAEELRDSGKIDEAIRVYAKVWRQKRNPMVGNNLGACLMVVGRYEEAKKILEEALKLAPSDPDLQYNLSLVGR